MSSETMEQAFQLLNVSITKIQQALEISFFEGYIETVENILDNHQVRVVEGEPNAEVVKELEELYQQFSSLELTQTELRNALQLVMLNGLQHEPVQPNHQLTPDALGFLFSYLGEQLLKTKKEQTNQLLDLTVGTGNLLYTVLLYLKESGYKMEATGVDIDDTLLTIASLNSALLKEKVTFFHQDSMQNLLVAPADLVISDLPIGYYPHDERVQDFTVQASEGHTYAHHLLMEQSMTYTKNDGFGIFLVPEDFLVSDQAPELKKWLQEKVHLLAVVGLPETLFQSANSRKSIIIVQNRSEQVEPPKEVLIARIPTLKDPQAIQGFFTEFAKWQKNNL
ncbi:class I SAM-dependent methyltransferase [Vagococcus xieshaowenii]|uniref:Class I SAM-dependent methyltransferase n=1 Tax=Vagococcus xieshaowenii TaxID=2562451 RepID=A0AAJ5JLA9_9ENTE|nr:class I SAM-dependent methyltransferase [Vagococcus xieshaowenii]QCA27973.1 class I SAM-dependent methyltransferase [Vagococcus xieshaowenii]TFZ41260.1 class I SAM-dependent methyltransferase [Vagococcus xieshaowenii]